MKKCTVVLERHRVSYTRHLEGLPGTWTERSTKFEGTYVQCWDYIQDVYARSGEPPMEIDYRITNRPPVQGPERPPKVYAEGELPF